MIDNDEARKTWNGVVEVLSKDLKASMIATIEHAHEQVTHSTQVLSYFEQFRGDDLPENATVVWPDRDWFAECAGF